MATNIEGMQAIKRTDFGKGYSRRVRANGQIPAVIYGHGAEPMHVILPGHQMMLAARNANAVLEIEIEGEKHLGMIKEVQRDPVRQIILHVDLLTVRRGERVQVDVPVTVEGEVAPTAVYNVELNTLLIEVDALKVPESITVNIEGLEAGEHVYASAIELPNGATLPLEDEEAQELLVVNVSEPIEQDLGEDSEEEGEESETASEGEGSSDDSE